DGHLFVHPYYWLQTGHYADSASHPPAYSAFLGLLSSAGLQSATTHRPLRRAPFLLPPDRPLRRQRLAPPGLLGVPRAALVRRPPERDDPPPRVRPARDRRGGEIRRASCRG